jgi:hypothetical protein
MSIFSRHNRRHLVPLHRDNARSKDWIVLLEANTIVGPSQESFRVARTTQERRIVRPLRSFRRLFLVVEGYDPRIHVLFFCPQLYKYDQDRTLVPMPGDEIANFIAQAIADKAGRRRPWYDPMDAIPNNPLIEAAMLDEFDTLVAEAPALVPLLPAPLKAGSLELEVENTIGSQRTAELAEHI